MRISDWSSDVCSSDLLGHRLRRDVGPGLAVVAGDVHQAVVGRCPDLAAAMLGFVHAGAARMHLGAGGVAGQRPAGIVLPVGIVTAEVRRDRLPAHPLVAGAEHVVAAGVEGRSEEHTSELQSLMRISYAVFCLKKKNKQ